MRVSVRRPSDRAKRQVLDLTRDEGVIGETQEVFGECEVGGPVFDQDFWAGFVTGLPMEIAWPFLPLAGKLATEVPDVDATDSSSSPSASDDVASGDVASGTGAAPAPPVASAGQI